MLKSRVLLFTDQLFEVIEQNGVIGRNELVN
jgi:hypothetical protein